MVNKYKSLQGGRLILESYDRLVKAWGVNVQETDVQTAYGRTHLLTAGDPANPPLVLFHGVGDDSALMWVRNAAALSKRFRLIAVDTVGGPGKSEPNEAYFKGFDQAKWIDGILDALGLDRLHMMHLNDSKFGLGTRKDRHALIAEGELGEEPFRHVMNDPRLARVAKVIETPKGNDAEATDRTMLERLRSYVE